MFFASISHLCLWDATADCVGITVLIICLVVRCLEVVVDHSTLLLLSNAEVLTLEFSDQVLVCNFLCLLAAAISVLLNEGSFGLRDDDFALSVGPCTDTEIGTLHLVADNLTIGCLSTLFGLCVNLGRVQRLSLAHASVVFVHTQAELSLTHAGFHLLSAIELVGGDLLLTHVLLVV